VRCASGVLGLNKQASTPGLGLGLGLVLFGFIPEGKEGLFREGLGT
jgi:hypothetical protein